MSIDQAPFPVLPPERCACADRIKAVDCVMSAEASSVPVLRRFARRVVQQWHLPDSVEEAVGLIVTELASNAVRHSGSAELVLGIAAGGGRLVLHVQDFGRWRVPATAGPAGEDDCSGRGLDLVSAFAADCRILPTPTGTRVTAELLLPDPLEPRCPVSH